MPLRVGDRERIGGSDALPVWRKELDFQPVLNGQNSWLEVLKGLELELDRETAAQARRPLRGVHGQHRRVPPRLTCPRCGISSPSLSRAMDRPSRCRA